MAKEIEVGKLKEIDSKDVKWLYHKSGSPIEEAYMIKRLMDEDGLTQSEVAGKLEISQGQVSKRLRLFSLLPQFQDKLRRGELRPSTAYALSRLPLERQKDFLTEKNVFLKAVEAKTRELAVSEELAELLEKPIKIEGGGEWFLARKKPVVVKVREVEGGTEEIKTLNGIVTAVRGQDFIIRGLNGEEYPVAKDIFFKTYEIVEGKR